MNVSKTTLVTNAKIM